MTTTQELNVRYGRGARPRRRRIFWLTTLLLALASVGALSWATLSRSLNEVGYDETGYSVIDDRIVTVSFQATPPVGTAFACAVQALDEDFGIVGWRIIEYSESEDITRAFTETIPTVARATTGTVESCWVS